MSVKPMYINLGKAQLLIVRYIFLVKNVICNSKAKSVC